MRAMGAGQSSAKDAKGYRTVEARSSGRGPVSGALKSPAVCPKPSVPEPPKATLASQVRGEAFTAPLVIILGRKASAWPQGG